MAREFVRERNVHQKQQQKRKVVMWQKKLGKDTASFGAFTPMGTARIIGENKGIVMATSFAVLPMVTGLEFSACTGCIQRENKQCAQASFCPELAASWPR
jgi:hypothetical protein